MHFDQLTNLYLQASSWIQQQVLYSTALDAKCSPSTFDWHKITATKDFEWHKCFGDFMCARLEVPMDWQGDSTEANTTVELAVIKVEATVSVTDPTYGGAVVLNPGGPGGSGVGQVLRGGHAVRTILSAGPDANDETAKNFDIIGFDPRGVNNTTPTLHCFPNELEAAIWSIEEYAHGMIDTSDASFDYLWASKRAMADGCSRRAAEESIGKHMSTAPVARDIIEIFERHGEWREKEADRLVGFGDIAMGAPSSEQTNIVERTRHKVGEEMVQYWGFSYGSILGATIAAMYPDRVKRASLDGVADSHDYMASGWTTNLQDTDLLGAKLAEYCYEGGPKNCALYDEDGPAVIAENLQRIIGKLRKEPIQMPGTSTMGPQVATYNDLKYLTRDIVYQPLLYYPLTAQILYDLSKGNGTSLIAWRLLEQRPLLNTPSKACHEDGPYSRSCFPSNEFWDAGMGIACSDGGLSRINQTKEEYLAYAKENMAQSQLLGAWWSSIQLPCTAWKAQPHWRYEGDFHSTTAHPILFVGNTIDPVTPFRNAFTMASGFEGAGILHLDTEGHCSYATVSLCAGRAIREYFQTGKLPGKKGGLEDWDEWKGVGGLCGTDRVPFDGYKKGEYPVMPEGERDEEFWKALVELNQVWP